MERRSFIKALTGGGIACATGLAIASPISLLTVTETKYERLTQHFLKAIAVQKYCQKEGITDTEFVSKQVRPHLEEAFMLIDSSEFELTVEDGVFVTATLKHILTNYPFQSEIISPTYNEGIGTTKDDWPTDEQRRVGYNMFIKFYNKYVYGGKDTSKLSTYEQLVYKRVCEVSNLHNIPSQGLQGLQGYYPEFPGKRLIV